MVTVTVPMHCEGWIWVATMLSVECQVVKILVAELGNLSILPPANPTARIGKLAVLI